jgi:hypothetical protein
MGQRIKQASKKVPKLDPAEALAHAVEQSPMPEGMEHLPPTGQF